LQQNDYWKKSVLKSFLVPSPLPLPPNTETQDLQKFLRILFVLSWRYSPTYSPKPKKNGGYRLTIPLQRLNGLHHPEEEPVF
jgi:hypothetical protein